MSTLSTSSPMQLALVDYLPRADTTPIFVACVASLRNVNNVPGRALLRYLPAEVKIHHSDSGYFLWLELLEPLDAGELSSGGTDASYQHCAGVKMFSTGENWSRFSF